MIELKDLLEEDEAIVEFHMCHEYWTRNAIIQKGNTDISGALEETLHRILEADGCSENYGSKNSDRGGTERVRRV